MLKFSDFSVHANIEWTPCEEDFAFFVLKDWFPIHHEVAFYVIISSDMEERIERVCEDREEDCGMKETRFDDEGDDRVGWNLPAAKIVGKS